MTVTRSWSEDKSPVGIGRLYLPALSAARARRSRAPARSASSLITGKKVVDRASAAVPRVIVVDDDDSMSERFAPSREIFPNVDLVLANAGVRPVSGASESLPNHAIDVVVLDADHRR